MSFHNVLFPIAIAYGSSGGPTFSTLVAVSDSGFERRNVNWSQPISKFNVASGVRHQDDLAALNQFYVARFGKAYAFLFCHPADCTTAEDGMSEPTGADCQIGIGDGGNRVFQLVKVYERAGVPMRRIIQAPIADTIQIQVNGSPLANTLWSLGPKGVITFSTAPASGAVITAGFEFNVIVRFDTDELSVSLNDYKSGSATVPLVEVRQ